MRAALRIILISLKARIRSITGKGWFLLAMGGILLPTLSFTMGKSVAWSSPGPQYLLPFLTGALNFLLLMQLGTAFSAAFYHLYLARDLPLFLVSPVRPRSVILARLLEVAATGIGAYAVAGVPLLVSLGVAWYAPSWYYPLAILAGIPFALIPAILAVLANLLVCRILPPYRVKEVTAALGTLIAALTYFFCRMALTTAGRENASGDISGVSSIFGRMGPTWSPSALLARAAIEGLFERPIPLIATAAVLLVVSTGLFATVLSGTERAYLSGWMVSGESRTRRQSKRRAQRHTAVESEQRGDLALKGSSSSPPQYLADSSRPQRTAQAPTSASAPTSAEADTNAPGSALTSAQRTWSAHSSTRAGNRLPPLSVERMSFEVESKLLFRDFQSQSQVVYVLVMVLALAIFPGRSESTSIGWLNSLSPFFFLIMAGSYASWAVKDMPTTTRLLGQFPVNPTKVMRGKALFYGLVQAGCALVLYILVKALHPSAGSEEAFALLTILTALAFSTGATSICAAAYDTKTTDDAGVPRLGAAGSIALTLMNAVLAVTCLVGYFIAAPMLGTHPSAGWLWVALVAGTQLAAFFVATNMAGNKVRRIAEDGAFGKEDDDAPGNEGGANAGTTSDDDNGYGGNRGTDGNSTSGTYVNGNSGGGSGKTTGSAFRVLLVCLLVFTCVVPTCARRTCVASAATPGSLSTPWTSAAPTKTASAIGTTLSTVSTANPASISDIPCHEVNGVRIYIQGVPKGKEGLSQIGAVMLTGTADQREDETHCAHMAEHMVFMYPRPSGESVWSIAAESYSLGSTLPLQGETGLDYTAFIMAVPEDDTLRALSIFLESLFQTTLTDDSAFRMEIKRSRRELTAMTTHNETALLNKLRLSMYKGTCYWENLFGTPLTAVSADKVRAFMEREYTPARLSLVVLSALDEKEVLDCVARSVEGIPPGAGPSVYADVRFDPPEVDVLELRPNQQRAGLAVGVSEVSPEDMAAVEALLNITTKRLYTGFQRGLGIKMEPSLHRVLLTKDTATATYSFAERASAQSIEDSVDQIAGLLREILASLAAEGPNLSELSRFSIPGSTRTPMPNLPPYREAEVLCVQLLPRGNPKDLLSEPEASRETTQVVLKAAAAKYLPEAKVTIVYIRNPPSSTMTWLILGGALVALVAVGWWRVRRLSG